MSINRHKLDAFNSRQIKQLLQLINTDIPADTQTLTNKTITGSLTGNVTGNVTGGITVPFSIKTDDYLVLASDSGTIFGMGTDGKTFTLPPTAAGLWFRFINTGADGNNIITIDPDDNDMIQGEFLTDAAAVTVSGTDGKTIVNTKGTATTGDFVDLVGDGVAGWFITGSRGIWADGA